MNFDALTLAAVVDELQRTLVGGRIQQVLLPTPLSIALEVYGHGRRHYLFASADPRSARVHLLETKPTRGVEAQPPLLLLLRKYVRNGIIQAVKQPPLERSMVLSILKRPPPRKDERDDDDVDYELCSELIVEVLGQRANIILVDDNNLILDAVKRVPGDDRRRSILPREPYLAPPRPKTLLDPRRATSHAMAELAGGDERNLAKAIVGAFAGVSPQQARETIVRAVGQPVDSIAPDLPWAELAQSLRELWTERAPSVAYGDDVPVAFAPYHMQQYPVVRPAATIGAALETYYAATQTITAHAQRRDALRQRLEDVRERLQHQLDALNRELAKAEALDRLRWEGEMIFGYLHAIAPGQRELVVEGETIKLDPDKTSVENAQARFRDYDKAKGALAGVPERVASTQAQAQYLDDTLALLQFAERYEDIAAIEREVQEQGLLKADSGKRSPRGPRAAPLRLVSSDGIPIYVGRSAGQNEESTFRIAQSNDLWLHAREVPGAHVIVKTERTVPERTLEEAAGLAAYFSALRNSTSVDVVVTERRHVRKVSGGPPGLVTYRNERALRVAPLNPQELANDGQSTRDRS
jgi:predicted ribosome quality control (RQC) complex YloA/Tae2 family protein